MQTINLDISTKGILPPLYTKQGDVGRKVRFVISDGGVPYNIPEDALLSVWYSGCSGEGNYDTVDENSAFSINGNAVTVELIPQMLLNHGSGTMCLVISTSGGQQIGLWNLCYQTEAVPGMESYKVNERYDSLFVRTGEAIIAAENAATDATTAANDARAVAEALQTAKANGEFKGEKGDKGDQGLRGYNGIGVANTETTKTDTPGFYNELRIFWTDGSTDVLRARNGSNGKAGTDGYTPQKGIDYYTPADQQEMVAAVIAQLPIYNGEVESV